MPSLRHLVLPLAILTQAATVAAAPTWLGFETEEEGVLTVMNPDAPMIDAPRVMTPEPLWRIGGDDDPQDTLLGLVTDTDVDEDGNAYVLDATLSTVLVVAEDGTILRTVGREGEGPGEFTSGQELELLPDGGVVVMELMPGRLVVMDREGVPVSGWRLGGDGLQNGMLHMRHMETAGDGLAIGLISTRFDEGSVTIVNRLARLDASGKFDVTYREVSEEQSGGSISLTIGGEDDFMGNFTVDSTGRVVVFRRAHAYELEFYGDDGSLQRILRRDYEPLRRTDEDLEEAREQLEAMHERFGGVDFDTEVEEFEDDIQDVVARPGGEIWVLSGRGVRGCPEGHLGDFDVFDADGRFVRTARIAADYDPRYDLYQFVDDRLFIYKEAQNAPDRTFAGGGGDNTMMMIVAGGGSDDDEDDDREPQPYEVICYRLDG